MVRKYYQFGSYYRAALDLGVDRNLVRYWVHKFEDENFHCQGHGGIFFLSFSFFFACFHSLGFRHGSFEPYELPILQKELLYYLSRNRRARQPELQRHLQQMFQRSIGTFFFIYFPSFFA